jgi:hypothetical protein
MRFLGRENAEPRDIPARLAAQFADADYNLWSVERWWNMFGKDANSWMMNFGLGDQ